MGSGMSGRTGSLKKRYIYCMGDKYKLTLMIQGPVPSSEYFKLLNKFGTRYSASGPYKEMGREYIIANIVLRK